MEGCFAVSLSPCMVATWVASHRCGSTCSRTPNLSGTVGAALRELSVSPSCSQAVSGSGCMGVLCTAQWQVAFFPCVEGALFLVAAGRLDAVLWDTWIDGDLACAQAKYHARYSEISFKTLLRLCQSPTNCVGSSTRFKCMDQYSS